jgi:hypothetical protein
MKKNTWAVSILLLAALLCAPGSVLADTATLSIVTPATVPQGSSFAVDVNISSASDLYDFQFDLGFNPAVLQLTNIEEGSFLASGGSASFFLPGAIDNVTGSATFNADTLFSLVPGVTGDGTLVQFDFMALATGTSPLTISNVLLQNSGAFLLASTEIPGSVTVEGTTPTPEPASFLMLGTGLLGIGLMLQARKLGVLGVLFLFRAR